MTSRILAEVARKVFLSHLSVLKDYIEDPNVQEIMVNGPKNVWVERGGDIVKVEDIEISDINMRAAVKALAGSNHKDVQPVLDCRMEGFRIAAALSPVGVNGNALCIRKHARSQRTLIDYMDAGGFDVVGMDGRFEDTDLTRPSKEAIAAGGQGVADFLTWMVKSRKNIMVAGGTGSGKTTFVNALLAEVPHDQRVLTIEDTAELRVNVPNYVGLESSENDGVDIRRLVRLALRFRPDRIIVGEVRGPEAYDLLDAMNTGHSGGACTLHADSPEMALSRMESMVRMNPDASNLPLQALRGQIAETFNFVIYCSRYAGRRGPDEIVEIKGVGSDGFYKTEKVFSRKGV